MRFNFLSVRQWIIFLLSSWCMVASALATPLNLNPAQKSWLTAHRNQVLTVGFDPNTGVDNFEFRGKEQGFLKDLLTEMSAQLGVRFEPAPVLCWDDAYTRFTQGSIDVLYGANPTPERERIMAFTRPALRYPYVVFARANSSEQTLGDLDNKRVGFITNDFAQKQLPIEYKNIHYQSFEFIDQEAGLKALAAGTIDGFVTTGGGVEHEYLFKHPELTLVATLQAISSEMTFAVLHERALLASIINHYIERNDEPIKAMAQRAALLYSRKILRLSEAELQWLDHKGEAIVGVAEDYLPFDYYHDGEYRGIAGATLKQIAAISGIRFKVVSGPFSQIYEQARAGSVDVLNLAKTEDRLPYFLYPRPISTERDIIVGSRSSPPVQDVYGLEGKRVAVIEGFWHEEYLRKNLKNAQIVKSADILESLRLVRQGKVDYMIENPTVVEFYINGLGYTDLIKRGSTAKDSFVYFGVNRKQPELASIIDKTLRLIKFEDMKYAGLQSVPVLKNEQSQQLFKVVLGLAVALVGILFITVTIVRSLVNQKAQTRFLKEREHLLHTDPLTGFYNRNYFSYIRESLDHAALPQAVVVADLNNLKRVNDTYGHAAGDALLVLFAQAIRSQFDGATCVRMGGDEFLLIVDSASSRGLTQSIEAMKTRCQASGHVVAPGVQIFPSAAFGYALRLQPEDSLDACMAQADASMYAAKSSMKKRSTDLSS